MAHAKRIPDATVRRLALYLRFLEESGSAGQATISSAQLAERGGTTSAQVRKDLSLFGSFGKRGLGYGIAELTGRLREILGLKSPHRVILIGAGKVGAALVHYPGFEERGFRVAAIYDRDPKKIGSRWNGLLIKDVRHLERDLRREPTDIAIVVTPAAAAQQVAERLIGAGVRAILNFAPVQLVLPDGVAVRNVNMALELETLSYALTTR